MKLSGGLAVDDRGTVSYVNDLQGFNTKRVYLVENFSTETVRGMHGHFKEDKLAFVVSGSALFIVAKMMREAAPAPIITISLENERHVLSARNPEILHIPCWHTHGFRALEPDTKIMFFSNATLEESKNDDFRSSAYFCDWSVKYR